MIVEPPIQSRKFRASRCIEFSVAGSCLRMDSGPVQPRGLFGPLPKNGSTGVGHSMRRAKNRQRTLRHPSQQLRRSPQDCPDSGRQRSAARGIFRRFPGRYPPSRGPVCLDIAASSKPGIYPISTMPRIANRRDGSGFRTEEAAVYSPLPQSPEFAPCRPNATRGLESGRRIRHPKGTVCAIRLLRRSIRNLRFPGASS